MSAPHGRSLTRRVASAFVLAVSAAAAGAQEGVEVTVVQRGYEAARVGLEPGDLLLEWQQGDAGGALVSPLGLAQVQVERAPKGELRLRGLRQGVAFEVSVASDEWGLETRPLLSPELAALHSSVTALFGREKNPGRDAPFLRAAAEQVSVLSSLETRAFLLAEIARAQAFVARLEDARATLAQARARHDPDRPWIEGALWATQVELLAQAGRHDEALAAEGETLRSLRAGGFELFAAGGLMNLAALVGERGDDPGAARRAAHEAVAIYERMAPRSTALARALERLAVFLPPAERLACLERSLALRDALPESLATAAALEQLGEAVSFSDAQSWVAYATRARDIQERLDPETLDHAITLAVLAAALLYNGAVEEAESIEQQALAIRERLAPESPHVADSLDRLGSIAMIRGDMARAETCLMRALGIAQRDTPDSVILAKKFQSLGQFYRLMGDSERAQEYLERALLVFEAVDSADLRAPCLTILGDVLSARGEAKKAEGYYRRALEEARTLGPDAPFLSDVEQNLGLLLLDQGRLDEAQSLLSDALARDERRGDRGRGRAGRNAALAALAHVRGDFAQEEERLRAALAVYDEWAAGTTEQADLCARLARVAQRRNDLEQAVTWLERGAQALELQGRRLMSSPEVRVRFQERHARVYRELETLLVRLGRHEEAWHVSERARARALLAHLAERGLSEGGHVASDLVREKRAADAEYDRVLGQLSGADSEERHRELKRVLSSTRRRQDDVRARIRAEAPRGASFHDPLPLDLAGLRQALEPGTLLLSYRLDPEHSRVYSVGPGPHDFAVLELDGAESALRDEVLAFRAALEARRGPMRQAGLFELSRRLSRRLLAPVAPSIARAQRLLIVPEGVLGLLPFAALADPARPNARRFLVESKPLHVVSSATLYAQLKRRTEPAAGPEEVIGFGDPAYPASRDVAAPGLDAAPRSRLRLEPLPWSRREVEALGEVSPGRARLWFGRDATEARAKSLGPRARIVHFACHGFVDERFPFESGLALSPPDKAQSGQDNGLLQAWEVFESVRLDADLVTLSACQTGVGRDAGGEGLFGLVWAFQYAGARSVLASLWDVNDAATAALMRRFYRALRAGASKADALRQAQLALLRRPATAAPYFWAAFQLTGDGR